MKTRTLLVALLALAVGLSGCIENMRDLKDRLGAGDEPEPVQPAAVPDAPAPAKNVTTKPPVARVSVYGANGALVYQSPFQAADVTDPIFVAENSNVTLNAGESSTLEPGAKLVSYTWSVAGKTLTGLKVDAAVAGPGVYPVMLTVTDSFNGTDMQHVVLAVAPKPYDVSANLTTDGVIGVESQGQTGTATFKLGPVDATKPATVTGIKFIARPPATCDAILEVAPPGGEAVQTNKGEVAGEETLVLQAPYAEGDYAIKAIPVACAAPDGVPVEVIVTYLPLVEGLASGGDGHGGHAH